VYELKQQKIVKCSRCGLLYLDKQRIDLENLYGEDYYMKSESNILANYSDYEDQEKSVKGNFRFAYKYIAENASQKKNKLLEIGAGFGYFIKYLPDNIESIAIEVSREAANALQVNTRASIFNGDFLDINLKSKFDFIVSYDVIEHQIDLARYLNKIRSLLKKNAVAIFTTPDFGSPINKIFGKNAPLIQPLYHNYYFTKDWFKRNIKSAGYDIVSLRTSYFANSSIGNIILLGSFAFPFLRKIRILELAKLFKLTKLTVPFIRFGGIQCILKKV
jgi:SAM-dependent methyltransferase